MNTIKSIRTLKQYDNLSEKQLLRMDHAAFLLLIQEHKQTRAAVMTLVELMADKLSPEEKQKLANTELDPEPLPSVQRRIEKVQQELEEDLLNGIYDAGL